MGRSNKLRPSGTRWFNFRFIVNLRDRCLEGRDHLGAMLGNGKAVTMTTTLM
jgi:hypothetical protein